MMKKMIKNITRLSSSSSQTHNLKPTTFNLIKSPQSQKGSALVIAAIFMVVASMLIVIGTKLLVLFSKQTKQQTLQVVEAENAARAGLVDGINWYRRQPVNYVAALLAAPSTQLNPTYSYIDDAFNPSQTASPPDTLDATIGIVAQYPINGAVSVLQGTNNIWARYEVRRQKNTATNPIDPKAVHDVSGERVITIPPTIDGRGLVWSLYSIGYIYLNANPALAFNQPPNKVLATSQMSTEIRKLSLIIPATAAALSPSMCNITANSNGVINGGKNGYACAAAATATGCPHVNGTGSITNGSPPPNLLAAAATQINGTDPSGIFGLSPTQIKDLADFTGDSTSKPLTISGSDKLSYFYGNLTYDPNSPVSCYQNQYLNNVGTGVIYVDSGNFYLKPVPSGQIGAFFSGVIFVSGYVTIGEGNSVNGCVMATNGITVGTGTSGAGKASLNFAGSIITREQQTVGVYREDKASAHNFVGVPNL